MKAILTALLLTCSATANAIVTVQDVGVPGEEQTFLQILEAHSDTDMAMTGFSNIFENPTIQPAVLDLSSLSARVYPVHFKMNLGAAAYLDYILLNSPVNRTFLSEMIPDPNVKVVGIKTYSIRYIKVKFEQPRIAAGIPMEGMRMYGLKSITLKTGTGFVFEMDLDPDQELYRYLSLMSEVPLTLPHPQGML